MVLLLEFKEGAVVQLWQLCGCITLYNRLSWRRPYTWCHTVSCSHAATMVPSTMTQACQVLFTSAIQCLRWSLCVWSTVWLKERRQAQPTRQARSKGAPQIHLQGLYNEVAPSGGCNCKSFTKWGHCQTLKDYTFLGYLAFKDVWHKERPAERLTVGSSALALVLIYSVSILNSLFMKSNKLEVTAPGMPRHANLTPLQLYGMKHQITQANHGLSYMNEHLRFLSVFIYLTRRPDWILCMKVKNSLR